MTSTRKISKTAGNGGNTSERDHRIEWRIRNAAGGWDWVESRGSVVHYEGKPRVMTVCRDISERKRAEQALRKSERVLREAENFGHTGSWEHDLITGEIFHTNENPRLFFGDNCSKGARFEDYIDAVHPDDRAYVTERHAQLLAEGGLHDIEFRVLWPDGSLHVLVGRAIVVRNDSGEAVRLYGTNVDITERKRTDSRRCGRRATPRAHARHAACGCVRHRREWRRAACQRRAPSASGAPT